MVNTYTRVYSTNFHLPPFFSLSLSRSLSNCLLCIHWVHRATFCPLCLLYRIFIENVVVEVTVDQQFAAYNAFNVSVLVVVSISFVFTDINRNSMWCIAISANIGLRLGKNDFIEMRPEW